MRGRLIQPFLAELYRLDTNSTAQAAGYDADFKTTKVSYPAGVRTSSRRELAAVRLPCQVEIGQWHAQRVMLSGNAPDTRLTLVFHYRDLEAAGLVDAETGEAKIRVNDRLAGIYDSRTGEVTQKLPGEGVYATEVQQAAFGIGRRKNLLVVIFEDRPKAVTT